MILVFATVAVAASLAATPKDSPEEHREKVATLAAGLFENVKKLPPPYPAKETPAEYDLRTATITYAAAEVAAESWPGVAGRWRIGNAILSLVYGETRFDLDLHAGPDTDGLCRDGKSAKARRSPTEDKCLGDGGRAIGLGQIHDTPVVPKGTWVTLSGTSLEATKRNLEVSSKILFRALRYCKADWTEEGLAQAYTLYGTGATCKPKQWARHRAHRWALMVAGKKPTKDAATAFLDSGGASFTFADKRPTKDAATAFFMEPVKARAYALVRVKELPSLPSDPLGEGFTADSGVYCHGFFLPCDS